MVQVDKLPSRPALLLHVKDLVASRAFYTEVLGFGSSDEDLPATLAVVTDFSHEAILLAGPDAGDITDYVQERYVTIEPGTFLTLFCPDLDELKAQWATRGFTSIRELKTVFGDAALGVRDPDGNILLFTTRSAEDVLERYAQGPQLLDEALAGLSEQDLQLTKSPGEWSIQQLVHHISDGDDLWMHVVKAALTQSGCQYRHDWYTTDNASAGKLDYAGRAIGPALALFRANHEHTLQLVRHLPAAMKRCVVFTWVGHEATTLSVQDMLHSQAYHVMTHCKEIQEIRRIHGR
ncbi:hypothetical protein KDA_43180 [Dictyobacter alpinus]|uniref:VOC domain-containing protein n=1 Tax=Dictyobacter alpinus TaxID=2014873 RepID=A0A402BBX5_9CHLR|nr:DinB family protein [Dictyobacter alpinus]GCE28834.1 hypothetical protein KDA_43180 [Dictyobacter alpinus]